MLFFKSLIVNKDIRMSVNATLFGQLLLVFAVLIAAVSFYLGRRKTQTPVLAALLGGLLALVPPLGLLYLAVLVLRRDLAKPAV